MSKYILQPILRACELREKGLSYAQIGRMVRMHPASVLEYCQANGALPPKPAPLKAAVTFTPEMDAQLIEMRRNGETVADIVRATGRADKSIRNRLRALAFNEAKIEAAGEAA